VFGAQSADSLIDALVDFADNVHRDENSSVSVTFSYQPELAGGMVSLVSMENTLALTRAPAFDGFFRVEGALNDTTRVDTVSALAKELSEGQPAGFRYVLRTNVKGSTYRMNRCNRNAFITATFKNDRKPIKYALEKVNELNAELEQITQALGARFATVNTIQPITRSIIEKGIANGGNAMGLDRYVDDGNSILFLLIVSTDSAEVEKLAIPKAEALVKGVEDYAEMLCLRREWKYLNYAHGRQDAVATFGEEAIGILQAASTKYDPDGVFQRLRASGFKIPEDG
jgi:hypothetical protein